MKPLAVEDVALRGLSLCCIIWKNVRVVRSHLCRVVKYYQELRNYF